jgi:hypothetical protein
VIQPQSAVHLAREFQVGARPGRDVVQGVVGWSFFWGGGACSGQGNGRRRPPSGAQGTVVVAVAS